MQALGVETFQGSITDASLSETACKGVDAIIHTAALAGVWGPKHLYEESNVNATRQLLQVVEQSKIPVFVYTSSPSVTFDGRPQVNMDETAPYPKHWLADYPRTKAIAEKMVLDANSSKLRTCALRPHLIWGTGDPHLFPRVVERCRQNKLMRVGDGKNLIDTVHVDSAAQAHVQALVRMLDNDQRASGEAYFLTDGAPVECWDWIRTILQLADLDPPKKAVPLSVAYAIGATLETAYKILGKIEEPPMTRFVAKQLGVDHYFNIQKAKDRLGFTPITDKLPFLQEMKGTL